MPITIVGLGQMGSMIGYRLINMGHAVRIIDSRKKYEKKNNQIPWGWLRKFSLQSQAKKRLVSNYFPFQHIEKEINKTHGPMLLSSMKDKSLDLWNQWIKDNPDTDARVLKPRDASREFNINEKYFQGSGGVFMCDTRDCLMDFKLLNDYLWDYLENHPKCDLIEDCHIDGITTNKKNIATDLLCDGDVIPIDKAVFTVGNQTSQVLDNEIPIIKIDLPYGFVKNVQSQPYIALWNKYSSINYFGDGTIKIACGTQSIVRENSVQMNTALNFVNMGLGGFSNLHFGKTDETLFQYAINELTTLGIVKNPEVLSIESCTVDITPNLCPYIYYLPKANNVLSISGFSGSGSMAIDDRFTGLLTESILKGKLDEKLESFEPKNDPLYNFTIPDEKKTPLSSIV